MGRGVHRRPRAVPEPGRATSRTGAARFYAGKSVRVYHVHADSIFDFRPRWSEHRNRKQPKFKQSRLEQLLDILIAGTDEQVELLAAALGDPSATERKQSQAVAAIAGERDRDARGRRCRPSTSP